MRYRCPTFYIAAALALATTKPAWAVEPTTSAAESSEFKRGHAALTAKDWASAEQILSRLWVKTKTYDVALSLGQSEFMLNRYRDAAEHLAFGIRYAPPRDYPAAETAKKALERAKSLVGTLKLIAPPGSEIQLDGKSLGVAPLDREIYLDAGVHLVKAVHPSIGWGSSNVEVAIGTTLPFEVRLTQKNPRSAAPAADPNPLPYASNDLKPPPPPPPPVQYAGMSEGKLIFLIAGGTVTLGAAVSTIAFAATGSAANGDARDLLAQATNEYGTNPCSSNADGAGSLCASIDRKLEQRSDSNQFANWSLAITGIAATATVAAWLVWPNTKSQTSRSVQIVPIAGRSVGGLLVDGRF